MSKGHEHGGNVFAVARSLGVPAERIVDFSASINPLGMAPGVREVLADCFDRLLHYPDKHAFELKERLAAYHGIASEQVCVANGSTELIHLLPRLLPGKRALIVAPAFAEYESALRRADWDVEYLVLDSRNDFRLPLSALQDKLERCDLLFLCNPANPTGALVPETEIAEIVQLCAAAGAFFVLDEAFMDFCEGDSAKAVLLRSGRGIVLRSMTKFFAIPGLRLGYAIADAGLVERLEEAGAPWSVNTAAQLAGIASLQDGEYRERTRRFIAAERSRMAAAIDALGWARTFSSAANYLLVELRNGMTAAALKERLLRHGLMIRDCANFHGLDARFFRVAVRLKEENDRLLVALAEEGRLD
ncbi:threonine-phosphate decarboxylase CobD [Geomesophilobacter sediminis]|uniref:threonine-phosphate decarboxylase n=1 Tax=Geomesophilobacter sediminis TaxID=2798584 RepID=A0A8J7IPE5_9BACT|nr:threonine-phosphate decarboxylase CobD [Geomesophilobacter sediminis]MBJ6725418.1 threonine-phosphate decarboxylase [Geomesophilobacter sediminis]